MIRLAAAVLGLALFAPDPVFAVDGVVEINQTAATAGGITPGDAPGFPVTIGSGGSYRLTSNLLVVAPAANAIVVAADHVTIDLGGFSIVGPGSGSGRGIEAGGRSNVTVRNGSVTKMGGFFAVSVGTASRVEGIHAIGNAGAGIALGDQSVAIGCTATGNGGAGIVASSSASVSGSAATGNAGDAPTTFLLFPFVTNQVGFDTGFSIANTTADPASLGTPQTAGACTLTFFGANAPAAFSTPSLAAGTTYAANASTIAPNFQGYMVAECGFPLAHGLAFLSDVGTRNFAMGYLARVVRPGRLQNLPEGASD